MKSPVTVKITDSELDGFPFPRNLWWCPCMLSSQNTAETSMNYARFPNPQMGKCPIHGLKSILHEVHVADY